jgi:dihydrodipicolinate synthase/N-acetylneuraminate lyase
VWLAHKESVVSGAAAAITTGAAWLLAQGDLQQNWPIWAVGIAGVITTFATFIATFASQIMKPWLENRGKIAEALRLENEAQRRHELELERLTNDRIIAEAKARAETRLRVAHYQQEAERCKLLSDWYRQELERLGWEDPRERERDDPGKSRIPGESNQNNAGPHS